MGEIAFTHYGEHRAGFKAYVCQLVNVEQALRQSKYALVCALLIPGFNYNSYIIYNNINKSLFFVNSVIIFETFKVKIFC